MPNTKKSPRVALAAGMALSLSCLIGPSVQAAFIFDDALQNGSGLENGNVTSVSIVSNSLGGNSTDKVAIEYGSSFTRAGFTIDGSQHTSTDTLLSFDVYTDLSGAAAINLLRIRFDTTTAVYDADDLTIFVDGVEDTAGRIDLISQTFQTVTVDLSTIAGGSIADLNRLEFQNPTGNGFIYFDNVQLTSAVVIPEPSTYAALLALGALSFAVIRRKRKGNA